MCWEACDPRGLRTPSHGSTQAGAPLSTAAVTWQSGGKGGGDNTILRRSPCSSRRLLQKTHLCPSGRPTPHQGVQGHCDNDWGGDQGGHPQAHVHTCTHMYTLTHLHVHTHTYIYTHTRAHARTRAHSHIHTLTHTCAHTRTLTHTKKNPIQAW